MCIANPAVPHRPKRSDYEADFFNLYKNLCAAAMKDLKGMQEVTNK